MFFMVKYLEAMRLLAIGAVGLLIAAPSPQDPDTSVKAVTAAAAAYLAEYQKQFSFLLADEEYVQQVFDQSGRETARRRMTGESFLTFVPADRAWISVHDVAEVDGKS